MGAKICVTKGVKTVTKTKTRLVETSFTDWTWGSYTKKCHGCQLDYKIQKNNLLTTGRDLHRLFKFGSEYQTSPGLEWSKVDQLSNK